MYITTIDTGTTNTRVKLWRGEEVVTTSHMAVGVRDTGITGSKDKLQHGVKEAINQMLGKAGVTHSDISLFLASGMITSNVGLYEVPHVFAPAGVTELSEQMVSATIHEVMEYPIWFVPGVKNEVREVTLKNCADMDIMRGEEVETLGLLDHLNLTGPALLILPGSHSKFIRIDQLGRISGCVTTLAGELLSVLTTNTILSSSLESSFAQELDPEMVKLGAEYAEKFGLTRTCFSVRILDQFTDSTVNGRASFLVGAIVNTDFQAIKGSNALGDCRDLPVVIGGSNTMAEVFEILVRGDDFFRGRAISVGSEVMAKTSGFGAIMAARVRGLCS